jgi:CcmD family protein
MTTGALYLFAAFGITWLIIFFYILSISRRQKTLEREIEKISEFLTKHQET